MIFLSECAIRLRMFQSAFSSDNSSYRLVVSSLSLSIIIILLPDHATALIMIDIERFSQLSFSFTACRIHLIFSGQTSAISLLRYWRHSIHRTLPPLFISGKSSLPSLCMPMEIEIRDIALIQVNEFSSI